MTLKLCSASSNKEAELACKPSEPFSSILAQYCSNHLGGTHRPSQLKLLFDGDFLDPAATPEQLEMEDGDQLDVKIV